MWSCSRMLDCFLWVTYFTRNLSLSPVRKHFQACHRLWHMACQPWNGEWDAESHHYGSSIILSLACCLLRCHLTPHLPYLPVSRGVLAGETESYLGLLPPSFSRNQNQSSGVVSNYVQCTVKRLWHLVPTRGSSTGWRCWVHQQNHQVQCVEGKAPGSLPFNAFVHPHFTCPKYCLQLTSPASIWRSAALTPQPSRQLVCVNNYSNKSVIGPLWYETVWDPLQCSKPDKCSWASVVHKRHCLFPQQMTQLRPEQAAFPPPLHPCRSRPSCNADMSCPSVPHLAAYSSGASTRTVCQFCKMTIISRETLKSYSIK